MESVLPVIERLCRDYRVQRLWVFGSALSESWNPTTSDFDFAAEFAPPGNGLTPLKQFFGFQRELEHVLNAPVDLVEWSAAKNPIFRRLVESSRKEIYAA